MIRQIRIAVLALVPALAFPAAPAFAEIPEPDTEALREVLDSPRAGELLFYTKSEKRKKLITALLTGDSAEARRLIAAGEIPAEDTLCAAVLRPDSVRYNGSLPDPEPGLLAELVRHGNVNSCRGPADDAPLFRAADAGMGLDVMRILAEAGAEIDPYTGTDEKKRQGYTPHGYILCHVLRGARDVPEVTAYFLDLGVSPVGDVSGICGGGVSTMLDLAAAHNKPLSAQVLVRAGADPAELLNRRVRFAVSSGIYDADGRLVIQRGHAAHAEAQRDKIRERVLAEARKRPERALISPDFYASARPEDVLAMAAGRSLGGIHEFRYQADDGDYAQYLPWPLSELFEGTLPRKKRTVTAQTTPLAEAARHSPYPEVIAILANAGCDVRELNSKALIWALMNPNPEVLAAVLRLEPDLSRLDPMDWEKMTVQQFSHFLDAGADIDAGADQTPLMAALDGENLPLSRALVRAGADLNRSDSKGGRALTYAIKAHFYALALDMIAAGAAYDYTNKEGRSLTDIAGSEAPCDAGQNEAYRALLRKLGMEMPG